MKNLIPSSIYKRYSQWLDRNFTEDQVMKLTFQILKLGFLDTANRQNSFTDGVYLFGKDRQNQNDI